MLNTAFSLCKAGNGGCNRSQFGRRNIRRSVGYRLANFRKVSVDQFDQERTDPDYQEQDSKYGNHAYPHQDKCFLEYLVHSL